MTLEEHINEASILIAQGKDDEAMTHIKKAAKLLLLKEAQERIARAK